MSGIPDSKQIARLKTMYGNRLQKYRGCYVIKEYGKIAGLISSKGVIKVDSVENSYGEFVSVDDNKLASLDTLKVSKAAYHAVLAIANEYIIASQQEINVTGRCVDVYYKICVIDSNLNEVYEDTKADQHLINIFNTDDKLQVIIRDSKGNIRTIVVPTKGVGKIREVISDTDRITTWKLIFHPYKLMKLGTIDTCKDVINKTSNVMNKENIYQRGDILTATMVYAGMHEIIRLMSNNKYDIRNVINSKYQKDVYEVTRQIIENGLDEYYRGEYCRNKFNECKKNKLLNGAVTILRNRTGDKMIKNRDVVTALSVIKEVITEMNIDDIFEIWKRNKYTNRAVNKLKKNIENRLNTVRDKNTELNKIEYDLFYGIYEALLGTKDANYFSSNKLTYSYIGYISAEYIKRHISGQWDATISLAGGEVISKLRSYLVENVDHGAESRKEIIERIISSVTTDIDSREQVKLDYNEMRVSFSGWAGNRLAKQEDLIIK